MTTKTKWAARPKKAPPLDTVAAVQEILDMLLYIQDSDDALACVYCANDKGRKALLALGIPESDLPRKLR